MSLERNASVFCGLSASTTVSRSSAMYGARRARRTSSPSADGVSTVTYVASGRVAVTVPSTAPGINGPDSTIMSGIARANVWNSSSTNICRNRAVSGSCTCNSSSASVIARSSLMVTSSLDNRASSMCSRRASRGRFFVSCGAAARIDSRSPNCATRSRAVFSPTPFTPGTLSLESPTRAR